MKNTDAIASVLRGKGREVFSVAPSTCVYDALEIMADKEIGALLVVENGRPVGLVSERDYARKVILQGRHSKDTAVSEIMSSDLVSVTPRDTVEECMRLMTEHRVRHLPVLHNGEVVGMVSLGDLVKWIIDSQEAEIRQLHAYIAGAYPTA
jgi:CBS domain-containing protein